MQIYMQCDNGEIEVFLCPEEDSLALGGAGHPSSSNGGGQGSSSEDNTDTESEASPVKSEQRLGVPPPSPPPRLDLDEESRSSDIGQIRNVLISASEDFGPVGKPHLQLQTLDQVNGKQVIVLAWTSNSRNNN